MVCDMGKARIHMIVIGVVQGVFFRASLIEKARSLGLTGWVKNLVTGEVECIAEGEKESLDYLLGWSKHGPPGAVVERVDIAWENPTGEFSNFRVDA